MKAEEWKAQLHDQHRASVGHQHRYADQQAAVMVVTDSDTVQVHLHRAMAAGLRCPLPTDLDDTALGARLFASLPTIHH
jgi:hypothetical protein